jgi:hypothetical protein
METTLYVGSENNNAYAIVTVLNNKKGKVLNNFFINSSPQYEQKIVSLLCEYAIKHGCKFIYTNPQTETLRDTFLANGFEVIYSFGKYDVLEKEFE